MNQAIDYHAILPELLLGGTILTAGYFLWMLQRVNMGVLPERWKEHRFSDMLAVEWWAWAPLLVGILALGLYPKIVFGTTSEAVAGLLNLVGLRS